jgi:hypothetical protein
MLIMMNCVESEGEDEWVWEDAYKQRRRVYAQDWQREYRKQKAQDYAKEQAL